MITSGDRNLQTRIALFSRDPRSKWRVAVEIITTIAMEFGLVQICYVPVSLTRHRKVIVSCVWLHSLQMHVIRCDTWNPSSHWGLTKSWELHRELDLKNDNFEFRCAVHTFCVVWFTCIVFIASNQSWAQLSSTVLCSTEYCGLYKIQKSQRKCQKCMHLNWSSLNNYISTTIWVISFICFANNFYSHIHWNYPA